MLRRRAEKRNLKCVLYGTYGARTGVHSRGYRDSECRYPGLGDYIMPRIYPYIGSLLLAAAIAAPALVVTEAKAQEAVVQVRVYDRNHGDYHNWTTAKTTRTDVIWGNSTGAMWSTTTRARERRRITGIGATVIRNAIKDDQA